MCLWQTRPILASLPSPQCVQHFSLQSLFSGSQLCSNQSRVHSTMHLPVVVDKKQDNAKTIISIFRNGREKIIMRNRRWNLHVVEWNLFQNSDTLIPISYIAQYHHCFCRSPPSFKSSDRFGMLSTGLLAAGTDTRGRLLRRNMIRWQTTELMYFLFIKYVCESWFDKLAVIKTKTTPDA